MLGICGAWCLYEGNSVPPPCMSGRLQEGLEKLLLRPQEKSVLEGQTDS